VAASHVSLPKRFVAPLKLCLPDLLSSFWSTLVENPLPSSRGLHRGLR
jgi:hypothetical protein